jgi:hypothetical protein
VRVFRPRFALEDGIGFHVFAPLEASVLVAKGIPLGCSLLLPVDTVNCIQTLKAALNMLRIDMGSANFGSVAVVFNRAVVDPMLLLCPVDTGSWELRCNSSAPDWLKQQFPVDCAAWEDRHNDLGVVGALDHTLLTSLSAWNDTSPSAALARLVARTLGHPHNISVSAYMRYIEADIAGIVPFPTGVKMIVASFPALFGTPAGKQLQQWCAANKWPLSWALAEGT